MLSFLKSPKATITFAVNGGPFYPSDIINLGLSVSSQESFKLRSATVALKCVEVFWRIVSDGKTTRNQRSRRSLFTVEKELIGTTEFVSGMALSESARFELPANVPPSVSGKIVNIKWQLEAKLNVARMKDIHEIKKISVLPVTPGIPVTDGRSNNSTDKVTATSADGSLLLTIDSEHGTAGEKLHGSLEALPQKDVSFTEIRAELETKESAGTKSSITLVDMIRLEGKSMLLKGNQERWSFELEFPDSVSPSIEVSSSKIEWNVKGIVARSMKKDLSVTYPIRVY